MKRLKRFLPIILAFISFATILYSQSSSIGKKNFQFECEDQYKNMHRWFQYLYKPQILIISDRKGISYYDNWKTPLKEKFEKQNIYLLDIFDLSDIKPFMKGYFRTQFKDRYNYPVFLDWDGKASKYYGCQAEVPNVIFLDSAGVVKYQIAGNGAPEQVKDAINQIDAILKKSSSK